MEDIIIKLKEAAEIKGALAKQEAVLWQKLSEIVESYLRYQHKVESKSTVSSTPSGTYLDTKGAAKHLGLSVGTMHGWRFYGTGPKYIKMGRSVRYKIEDLENFANKNITK